MRGARLLNWLLNNHSSSSTAWSDRNYSLFRLTSIRDILVSNLHGLVHIFIAQFIRRYRLVRLSSLHEHVNLCLKPFYLTFCHFHELAILKQLLGHIYAKDTSQVTHIGLLYLPVCLLMLCRHFVPLSDHSVLVFFLALHELHFQSFGTLFCLSYPIIALIFELLSAPILLLHLSNHRGYVIFKLLYPDFVLLNTVTASLLARVLSLF